MRNLLIVFILSIAPLISTYTQINALENQEINYEKGKTTYIEKGRKILTTNFIKGDIEEVKKSKNYLTNLEDDDFFSLFSGEYWLILYWTEEYKELINSIEQFEAENMEEYELKLAPLSDNLYETLIQKTEKNKKQLLKNIDQSTLSKEEKMFLHLHLKNTMADISMQPKLQDEINNEARQFIADYPNSDFTNFTKQFIHYQFKASDLGLGVELFSGTGIYTGELNERYNIEVPIGISIDASYDKYNLSLRQYVGFLTSKGFEYQTNNTNFSYPADANLTNFSTEVAFSYTLLDHSTLKAAPFASVGGMSIKAPKSETEINPNFEGANLDYTTTFGLGISLDFKLGLDKVPEYQTQSSYGFVRVRYGYYMPQFTDLNGGIHTITIGIGGIMHRLSRDF